MHQTLDERSETEVTARYYVHRKVQHLCPSVYCTAAPPRKSAVAAILFVAKVYCHVLAGRTSSIVVCPTVRYQHLIFLLDFLFSLTELNIVQGPS